MTSPARRLPFGTRHFLYPLQGHQTNGVVSTVDEKTVLPVAKDMFVHQILERQIRGTLAQ